MANRVECTFLSLILLVPFVYQMCSLCLVCYVLYVVFQIHCVTVINPVPAINLQKPQAGLYYKLVLIVRISWLLVATNRPLVFLHHKA